jgi:hypothetical protein
MAQRRQPHDLAARPSARDHDAAGTAWRISGRHGLGGHPPLRIHLPRYPLRAPELGWRSPDVALGDLQFRKGARFTYEYDLNIPWDHEVRLEDRLQSVTGQTYPYCVDGAASCPPEDCGGPAGFLERRDARYSLEGMEDLTAMADFLDEVVLKERIERLRDEDVIDERRGVLERIELRQSWEGKPFSRKPPGQGDCFCMPQSSQARCPRL